MNIPFPWSLVPGSQLQATPLQHGRLGVRINVLNNLVYLALVQ